MAVRLIDAEKVLKHFRFWIETNQVKTYERKAIETCIKVIENAPTITSMVKKEANMDKPRICEVLGVEVGEWWEYGGIEYSVTGKGIIIDHDNTVHFTGLTGAINYPDRIIRKPRFTKQEVEDAKTLLRVFPEQLDSISRSKDGTVTLAAKGAWRGYLNNDTFPSIQPGQSYTLDEIIGGAK